MSALQEKIQKDGKLPDIELLLRPLEGGEPVVLNRFIEYEFSSDVLVPVDSFSFMFNVPDGPPINERIKSGDIVHLYANGKIISTGIVDEIDVETDSQFGEVGMINGRDLMAFYVDQDSMTIDFRLRRGEPLYGTFTISGAVRRLNENTRIQGLILRDAPTKSYLFASEPTESKLSALQRYLEPLNVIAWMSPEGKMIVGRPNMKQQALAKLIVSKEDRQSNVISMKATRQATMIPNIITPIWSGQELIQNRVTSEQIVYNTAPGPTRLRKLGHRTPKAVVVSTPEGERIQDWSEITRLQVARAAGSTFLQAYAKRELARLNIYELIVQAKVIGHYNENAQPYLVDQVYHIDYDRGSIRENMYLYGIVYRLSESEGQTTTLRFTRLGTIVSDIKAA